MTSDHDEVPEMPEMDLYELPELDLSEVPELPELDLYELPELPELDLIDIDAEVVTVGEDFARRGIESSRSDPDGGRYHLEFLLRVVSNPADYRIPPDLAERFQAEVAAALVELDRLEAAPGAHDGAGGIPGARGIGKNAMSGA
jgi:hypothetical protein